MGRRAAQLLVAALLAFGSAASADEPPTRVRFDEGYDGAGVCWYGWQMLPFDAASLGVAAGLEDWRYALPVAVIGPAVHAFNGRDDRAALSLGIRVGTPLALYVAGELLLEVADSAASPSGSQYEEETEWDAVIIVGALLGVLIDQGLTVTRYETPILVNPPALVPLFAPVPGGGGTVGVQRTF